jgi:hypothetical protein
LGSSPATDRDSNLISWWQTGAPNNFSSWPDTATGRSARRSSRSSDHADRMQRLVDGDQILDVVTTTEHDQIAVALGRGDGTFDAPARTVASGQSDLALADVNNDGAPTFGHQLEHQPRLCLLNDRHGSFRRPRSCRTGKQRAPSTPQVRRRQFRRPIVAGPGSGPGQQCRTRVRLRQGQRQDFADPTAASCIAPTTPNITPEPCLQRERRPDLDSDGNQHRFGGQRNYADVAFNDGLDTSPRTAVTVPGSASTSAASTPSTPSTLWVGERRLRP